MNVAMITQKLDPLDQALSFTVDWVCALAERVDQLHVVCLEQRLTSKLPENVTTWSMGKELGYGRLRELIQFYNILRRVLPKVDVVFVHMIPRYALLALPLARLFRIRVGLWYSHPHVNFELRLATQFVDWIVTPGDFSFPLHSNKVKQLNTGVNAHKFTPGTQPKTIPPLIVSVGRLSPIKHHETLLDAAALLRDVHGNPSCQFVVAGAEVSNSPPNYRQSLMDRRAALGLSAEQFEFAGLVQSDDLVRLFQRAALSVNLMPTGSFDKAAIEAMMTGLVLIGANKDFASVWQDYTDLLQVSSSTDAAPLAEKIAAVLALDEAERARIGDNLRQRAVATHSLDRLMDRLVAFMADGAKRGNEPDLRQH